MKKLTHYIILLLLCFASPSPGAENDTPQKETVSQKQESPPLPFAEELKRAEEQGDTRFFEEFVNMFFTLGIIIVVIMLLMWILKRIMTARIEQTNLKSPIKILERRPLTPKTTVYILGIYGKTIAIADSINGVTLLSEVTPQGQSPTSFEPLLEKEKHKIEE